MKKGTIISDLKVDDLAANGKCISKLDGMAVFINGQVAPGDVIDLKVTRKKSSFLEGVPVNIHQESEIREKPFCTHFGTCGGCKWQHISYPEQIKFKQKEVFNNIKHLGGVYQFEEVDILGSEESQYYRNKLEFTFSNKRWLTNEQIKSGEEFNRNGLGFHIPRHFDKVVDVDHCYLQGGQSNEIRNSVREYALEHDLKFFDIREKQGLLRIMMVRTSNLGQTMIVFQFFENKEDEIKGLLDFINDKFQIDSLNYVINPKANDTIYDLDVITYSGKPYIEEKLGDLIYRIGPKTFYQTNSGQTQRLYDVALEFANLSGNEVVYDLYTGAGTIANYVAGRAKKVVGIESVPSAIEDAKQNSELNGITNTVFYAGDMKDVLNTGFIAENGEPDVIITDPPRAGMHEDVVKTILKVAPQKLVYVSCNSATQARDIKLLSEKYKLIKVRPVDMFPHTHHVESVALLEHKN